MLEFQGERMTELKPCPFCGSEVVEFKVEPIWWYVQCTSEQCKVRMVAHNREEIEEMWNRRVKE